MAHLVVYFILLPNSKELFNLRQNSVLGRKKAKEFVKLGGHSLNEVHFQSNI